MTMSHKSTNAFAGEYLKKLLMKIKYLTSGRYCYAEYHKGCYLIVNPRLFLDLVDGQQDLPNKPLFFYV